MYPASASGRAVYGRELIIIFRAAGLMSRRAYRSPLYLRLTCLQAVRQRSGVNLKHATIPAE